MISILRRGIKPEQKKEPALNRDIQVFTENVAISRLIPETKDLDSISAEKIIEIARIAEIADELDGKPLWEKLESGRGKVSGIAADALDDEPYLSSRLVLILQRREDVASGLRLCGKALGVEAEKQFAAIFHSLIAFSTKIPDGEDMRIRRLSGKYPIDLAEREKGERCGVLYIGAGAMVHLHRAVFEMRRQTTAFVTLAGDCVSAPFNAELPLGMPLKRALEFCGLSEEPTYICTNGSLTASPVLDPESAFVEADTKAILAFHRYDHASPAPCVGCGRCMEVCPQQLPVFYLYQASLHKQLSLLRRMGYERCYECGACTYACPSHLDLVPVLRQGKELVSAGLPEDLIQQSKEAQKKPETSQEVEALEKANTADAPPSEVPKLAMAEDAVEPSGAVPVPELTGGEQEQTPAVPEKAVMEEEKEIATIRETQFGREVLGVSEEVGALEALEPEFPDELENRVPEPLEESEEAASSEMLLEAVQGPEQDNTPPMTQQPSGETINREKKKKRPKKKKSFQEMNLPADDAEPGAGEEPALPPVSKEAALVPDVPEGREALTQTAESASEDVLEEKVLVSDVPEGREAPTQTAESASEDVLEEKVLASNAPERREAPTQTAESASEDVLGEKVLASDAPEGREEAPQTAESVSETPEPKKTETAKAGEVSAAAVRAKVTPKKTAARPVSRKAAVKRSPRGAQAKEKQEVKEL